MDSQYRLERVDPLLTFPVWISPACVTLVGMLCLQLPESDLDEANPLPYGHLAFVEDQAVLWVCRAWFDGRELGQLLVQFSAELTEVYALHDWQMQLEGDHGVRELLLALMSSARSGLRVIAAEEVMQQKLEVFLGHISYDLHSCTQLHWAVHAQVCLHG